MSAVMLHILWVTVIPRVSEPFERNNVARAVHEKVKFDAIKAQFVEVYDSPDICAPFMCFPFFSKPLRASDELFIILLLLISLCLCSHGGYYRRGRTWTRSSLSELSLIRSHPGDKGIPLIRRADGSLLPHDRPFPRNDVRSLLTQEPRCLQA